MLKIWTASIPSDKAARNKQMTLARQERRIDRTQQKGSIKNNKLATERLIKGVELYDKIKHGPPFISLFCSIEIQKIQLWRRYISI